MDREQLTKTEQKTLALIQKTGICCREQIDGRWEYFCLDGRGLQDVVINRLFSKGFLESSEDGLFPGMTQTYKIRTHCHSNETTPS